MISARITATLGVVLLIIGQGASAPTDDSTRVARNANSDDTDSVKLDPLDYVKQVDNYSGGEQEQPLTVSDDDDDDDDDDGMAAAEAEFKQLLPHFNYDYDDHSSSDDEEGEGVQNEKRDVLKSGNLVLTPSGYIGSGQGSVSYLYPGTQQQEGISQTLNSANYNYQGQSNFPASQHRQVISQTLNPAYATSQNNQDSSGQTNAAKLLYLMGLLANAHSSSSAGLVGYAQNSQSQSVLSGTSGGHLNYGQTIIPTTSNAYGSLGSNYGYLSSTNGLTASSAGTYDASALGGQAFIRLITPIARFVAIHPQQNWSTFLENLNQAQISGSGAYQTLYKQINYETQRQQRLIKLLKLYRRIAARKRVCNQTSK